MIRIFRLEDPALSPWLGSGDIVARYRHEVHRTDSAFGALIDGIATTRASRQYDHRSFSDHGEGLGDHDFETHYFSAYEEVHRVPLAIRNATGGRTVDTPVSLVDVAPTIVALLGGVPMPSDGRSLAAAFEGHSMTSQPVYADVNFGGPLYRVVVDEEWKLIYDWRRNTYALFDLADAPPRASPCK